MPEPVPLAAYAWLCGLAVTVVAGCAGRPAGRGDLAGPISGAEVDAGSAGVGDAGAGAADGAAAPQADVEAAAADAAADSTQDQGPPDTAADAGPEATGGDAAANADPAPDDGGTSQAADTSPDDADASPGADAGLDSAAPDAAPDAGSGEPGDADADLPVTADAGADATPPCPEPLATEACNGLDDDCDGLTDEPGDAGAPLCDDGDACTVGDACTAGACQPGAPLDCLDGNPCTDDACDPATGCQSSANAAPCDADGDACTVGDACLGGACLPGAVVGCDDGNACTTDACDTQTGACVQDPAPAQGQVCGAAGPCTAAPSCQAGACTAGPIKDCADGDPCTADACDAATGACLHVPGPCATRFQQAWGGAAADHLAAVQALGDGGLWAAGRTASHGQGEGDALLLRTDGCGQVLWARTYGGAKEDAATALALAADGGAVFAGHTASWEGAGDSWLVKVDASGEPQWHLAVGGPGWDYAQSVTQTSDGGFVAAAKTYSFGPNTPKWHNGLILKVDPKGVLAWSRVFGATDGSMDLVQVREVVAATGTPDGLLAVGGSEGFGQGWDDAWLMKLAPDGDHEWSVVHGSPYDDDPTAFVQAADGGFVLTGHTKGWSSVKTDVFLLKTDAGGNLQWFQRYGGPGKEEPAAVVAHGGGYLVTGWTTGADTGVQDAFALHVDAAGKLLWLRTFGGSLDDAALGLAVDAAGGFVLAGRTDSAGSGATDAWWVKSTLAGPGACGEQPFAGWWAKTNTPISLAFTPTLLKVGSATPAQPVVGLVAAPAAGSAVCPCVGP